MSTKSHSSGHKFLFIFNIKITLFVNNLFYNPSILLYTFQEILHSVRHDTCSRCVRFQAFHTWRSRTILFFLQRWLAHFRTCQLMEFLSLSISISLLVISSSLSLKNLKIYDEFGQKSIRSRFESQNICMYVQSTKTQRKKVFIFQSDLIIEVLLDTQYFLFFRLVRTRICQKVFRRVSRPHKAVHVRSMDFPNLVHTLVAIVPVPCWWS